ncbi:MAG TPA: hypothetical protein VGK73_33555 [Polyangiaceae bacterium]
MVRRLTYLLVLVAACGPDKKPQQPCPTGPDFEVLISAAVGPLPSDTVVRLYYGAGDPEHPEEFVLANPGVPKVLFCSAADREGNKVDGGLPSQTAASGGDGGESGAGGEKNVTVDALLCECWSFGSAELEIVTAEYPDEERVALKKKQGVCTVTSEIVLEKPDAGG